MPATTVQQVLAAPASSAAFSPAAGLPFNAWVLSGSWTGPLYLEKSPDGGTTWVPIELGGVRIFVATTISSFPVEESESGVQWRWTAGAGFSGTATVRLSQ